VLEVHFGDWNGRTLDELDKTDGWKYWNSFRSGTRIPNGETILEIQARMVRALERFRREQPEAVTAVFSHGDPIRATLVYYLGMPLDFLTRIEISPGSYSMLRVEDWGAEVLCVNRLPE
jgi:broad specificity phosphatase PhoE